MLPRFVGASWAIIIFLVAEVLMAMEWTISIERKSDFGDVCRQEVHIDKSDERLRMSGIRFSKDGTLGCRKR